MGFHAIAMKTQILSTYNYNQKYNTYRSNTNHNYKTKTINPNIKYSPQVNFTGNRPIDFLIRNLHLDPLLHFEKFTKEEYSRLSKSEIEKLRHKFKNIIDHSNDLALKSFDEVHNICPAILQDMFDKFFGAGEYVIITLGRSLSTIGKALGYRIGEDKVINMPMSWARRFTPESTRVESHFTIYNKLCTQEGLYNFQEYLNKLNLSKKQVEQSGKNYILMDFCYSGDSLKGAEFLFKSDYVWGPNANIFAVDFLEALSKYEMPTMKHSYLVAGTDNDNLLYRVFCGSKFKSYTQIRRATTLGETERASLTPIPKDKKANKERELMWFRLLDNAMQPQNLTNIKPKKENNNPSVFIQKIAPWNDSKKQAETDLRNDIQRVNYHIIKLDALDNWDDKNIKNLRRDLFQSYSYLTDFYNTYENNPYSIIEYYNLRNKIHHIIKNAESILTDTNIYNNLDLH